MGKNIQEFEGIVEECLPNAKFYVRIKGTTQDKVIEAYAAGKVLKNHIRIVEGDHVKVEVSPYDLQKGRITFRKK